MLQMVDFDRFKILATFLDDNLVFLLISLIFCIAFSSPSSTNSFIILKNSSIPISSTNSFQISILSCVFFGLPIFLLLIDFLSVIVISVFISLLLFINFLYFNLKEF
jgi:hypothetical protein